jgi:hypothetical protein
MSVKDMSSKILGEAITVICLTASIPAFARNKSVTERLSSLSVKPLVLLSAAKDRSHASARSQSSNGSGILLMTPFVVP